MYAPTQILQITIQIGRWCFPRQVSHLHSLSLRVWVCHPNTRIYVRLLGPCFKTGHLRPLSQRPFSPRQVTTCPSPRQAQAGITGIKTTCHVWSDAPTVRAANSSVPTAVIGPDYNTPLLMLHFQGFPPAVKELTLTCERINAAERLSGPT
jgi:hypothetical protein